MSEDVRLSPIGFTSKEDLIEAQKEAIDRLRGELRVLSSKLQATTALKNRFKNRMEYYKKHLDDLKSGIE